MNPLEKLLDTSDFPARWHCGQWSDVHGWTHILADLAVAGAYAAIPLVIIYFVRNRGDVPFPPVFWLFAAFIFWCGTTHLIEATLFWKPWYRLSALSKVVTALVSWATVIALFRTLPQALTLPRLAHVNRQRDELLDETQSLNRQLQFQAEDLRTVAKDRAILLQEVHHRVKNNLQIISSMMNMQNRQLQSDDAREALSECQNRVQAIALIHERLYQTSDREISFVDYTKSLASSIFHATGVSPGGIELELDIDDISLPVNQAIPCGLILSELITNAIKHAFSESKQGTLRVSMSRTSDNHAILRVRDDGTGMSPDVDPAKSDSLGLQLVTNLVAQLDGELTTERNDGTSFTIRFPIEASVSGHWAAAAAPPSSRDT